jgi:hypothetical protein
MARHTSPAWIDWELLSSGILKVGRGRRCTKSEPGFRRIKRIIRKREFTEELEYKEITEKNYEESGKTECTLRPE